MKKIYLSAGLVLVAAGLAVASSWSEFSRLDWARIPRRAAWQLPSRVVESLDLEPGSRVADVGAGDGYFTFFLADAVGPAGKVYAVEVEEQKVEGLRDRVRERGYDNVEVVLGEYEDPLLPDGAIDLVFLCNSYHHIEKRRAYFSRLRGDLRDGGRVALVEMREDLAGVAGLFSHPGHATSKRAMTEEMEAAGYRGGESFDFLPVQHFEIFLR